MMEAATYQKFVHTSSRKLRLLADMVRKMEPNKALDILAVTPKAAAKDLSKAIKTVLANAKQKGMTQNSLFFKKLEINEGTSLRRLKASTRGRVRPFKRRTAHIKIVLSDEAKIIDEKGEKDGTKD